jgi:hypothetical protein
VRQVIDRYENENSKSATAVPDGGLLSLTLEVLCSVDRRERQALILFVSEL